MKIIYNGNQFNLASMPNARALKIELQLTSDSQTWTKPIQFMVDTGSTGPVALYIPEDVISDFGLKPNIISHGVSQLADGTTVQEKTALMGFRLNSVPNGTSIAFLETPVAIGDGGTPLLGLDVLSFLNVAIREGKLVLLAFS